MMCFYLNVHFQGQRVILKPKYLQALTKRRTRVGSNNHVDPVNFTHMQNGKKEIRLTTTLRHGRTVKPTDRGEARSNKNMDVEEKALLSVERKFTLCLSSCLK